MAVDGEKGRDMSSFLRGALVFDEGACRYRGKSTVQVEVSTGSTAIPGTVSRWRL